jgi:hypothetical protein
VPLDVAPLTAVTHRRSPKDEYIKDVDLMTTPTDGKNPEDTLARWRAEEAAVRARV